MADKVENMRTFVVLGSERRLLAGAGATAASSLDCPTYWFSGESTTILGGRPAESQINAVETVASWNIPIDRFSVGHADAGQLLVGCRRYFGGLHSKRLGARVDIWFNGQQLDGFGLFVQAPHHSDYFHRVPPANPPKVAPFDDCETLYAWPVRAEQLHIGESQELRIRLDHDARWDIDYVGLQLRIRSVRHRVFLSHASEDKQAARLLADGLRRRGVGVWLDEAEMRVGDSLLAKISTAIGSVEYVVALISRASVASPWVQKELLLAMQDEIVGNRVKVLPVRLAEVEVPNFLKDKVYVDCPSEEALPSVIEQLVTRVTV